MNAGRFAELTGRYAQLRVGVVGDFFLDRYLCIDPSRSEVSIETGLPVHNVVEVRSQPGAAGTVLNNLVALGVGEIHAVGFCGDDGEGFELRRALGSLPGVDLGRFLTSDRRTPVYCKPILVEPGKAPVELSRYDSKNWTPTPADLAESLASRVASLAGRVDALILMEQVDLPETGVVTRPVKAAASEAQARHDRLVVLADSRQGLRDFPPLSFKMNAAELARMTGDPATDPDSIARMAAGLAAENGRPVFVTMAELGMIGAPADAPAEHVAAHPVRGEIDIVGAGDSVTANLAVALAAGASIREAMEMAMAAASVVIHQLGTSGTASTSEIGRLLGSTSID